MSSGVNMSAPLPGAALIDQPVVRWECPNCDVTDVTVGLHPNRFHTCAGLHMLSAPLVRADPEAPGLRRRCKVEATEREDYLNGEIQNSGDDGKPYMNIRTTWDDHDDLAVNAGLAQVRIGDYR
jgi:hypothetical protein